MLKTIRIATRQSALALWQANYVKDRLNAVYPHISVKIIGMTTQGDKLLETSLAKLGGKGLFIKELEAALLQGNADIAVHSMKDLPVTLPDSLGLAAICHREQPFDAFVSNHYDHFVSLAPGSRVGTSSLRRQAILKRLRPDLDVMTLRGNVETRLSRLDDDKFDAIILAYAGMKRLGLRERIKHVFTVEECLPAIGQGAIGIECCQENTAVWELVSALDHKPTHQCLLAERTMNQLLGGSCQLPVAGYAVLTDESQLWLRGLVASPDGKQWVTAECRDNADNAKGIGENVAKQLLQQGAAKILDQINHAR